MLFAFIMEIVISALSLMPVIGQLIATLGGLALMWLNIVVSIRRLHDLDKSGWLLLLPGVPYILFFLSLILAVLIYDSYLFLVMCYACVVAAIGFSIYLLVLTITKGTTGPNRFGPDPLGFEYHEGSLATKAHGKVRVIGKTKITGRGKALRVSLLILMPLMVSRVIGITIKVLGRTKVLKDSLAIGIQARAALVRILLMQLNLIRVRALVLATAMAKALILLNIAMMLTSQTITRSLEDKPWWHRD